MSGGVSRVTAMLDGTDLEEEEPDFTDSGMLERTDTLPEEKEEEGERQRKRKRGRGRERS